MTNQNSSTSLLFIELYSYKPAWSELSLSDRTAVAQKVVESLDGLRDVGVTVLGYGRNDPATSYRAPYDFFAVYQVPDLATQEAFEKQVEASGWYGFFDQVNIRGSIMDYAQALIANATDPALR